MQRKFLVFVVLLLLGGTCLAEDRSITMQTDPVTVAPGEEILFQCTAAGEWRLPLTRATIEVRNTAGSTVLRKSMSIDGNRATATYQIPNEAQNGNWEFVCTLADRRQRLRSTASFAVTADSGGNDPGGSPGNGPHSAITSYEGPATCISCHAKEADDMLNSLHMQWNGATPELINTNGEPRGKANLGINTFCTYAMSSKGACFSCHVRADGNAPHPPEATDVDCLMCHNDTYQRKFVADPENTVTVTNVLGETKSYVFGKVDNEGNYQTAPDFDKMPAGTTMVDLARTVHLPTTTSCLRCHAKAGGGDWTKRGDMGLNSATATREQDVHLSADGANLSCTSCHPGTNHKIGGRGIDLRQTEAKPPACQDCHNSAPHSSTVLNRHAQGQVSCQVCHIRTFAKGGATEMSRDWRKPHWNPAFCSGQGGFVGEELKQSDVVPEYTWFDGTAYVYNLSETIEADAQGVYRMAVAHGAPFDGRSSIVPIKRHRTVMALHESGQMVAPAIMWMFMTGDFDQAVEKGMEDQGLTGTYTLVDADAEMLITHGVDPKEKAPTCSTCHDGTGRTADGTGMLPLTDLGYHTFPAKVAACTLCHEPESADWQSMHNEHRSEGISCSSCHTSEPTGLISPAPQLCSSCHNQRSWREEGHKKHLEKGLECSQCHSFT